MHIQKFQTYISSLFASGVKILHITVCLFKQAVWYGTMTHFPVHLDVILALRNLGITWQHQVFGKIFNSI